MDILFFFYFTSERVMWYSLIILFHFWQIFVLLYNNSVFCAVGHLLFAMDLLMFGFNCLVLCNVQHKSYRSLAGPWKYLKVFEFFSRFSRPEKSLKTDMVLESPWIRFSKNAVTEQVIAITRCVSWALMTQKCVSGRGCALNPAGELTALPQTL